MLQTNWLVCRCYTTTFCPTWKELDDKIRERPNLNIATPHFQFYGSQKNFWNSIISQLDWPNYLLIRTHTQIKN